MTTPSIGWNGSSRRAEITALSQASALDGDAAAPLSKRAVLLSFLPSVALPLFLAAVDQTITATALPAIAGQLGQVERVSWVVVSYLIAGTIAAPIYGRLGDALGRKRMMFGALAVFITASALCALSGSILALTGARLLQGLGAGGLMTLSQALIGEYIPARERGRYQGYLATVFVTAASVGPVAGGYLTQHFGWQSVFWINVPLGLLAVVLLLRLPGRAMATGRLVFDYAGCALFIVFVTPLLLALEQAQHVSPRTLPTIAALVAVSLAALLLLLRQERRAPVPLIPVNLLRQPTIWRPVALGACVGGIIVPVVSYTPIYLQVVRGYSPAQTGLLLLPLTVGISVGSMITGSLIARTGRTALFPSIGQPVVCTSLMILALMLAWLPIPAIVGLLALISMATGTGMVVVQTLTQLIAGPRQLGSIAATVQLGRSLGASFGAALAGAALFAAINVADPALAGIFAELMQRGPALLAQLPAARQAAVQTELAGAFRAAYLTIACVAATGSLLAWVIPTRKI